MRSLLLLSFGSWKGQAMKTLEELKAELTQKLLELQRLTGIISDDVRITGQLL